MNYLRSVRLSGIAAAAAMLGAFAASPASAVPTLDQVLLSNGSTLISFTQLDESHEFFNPSITFATPANFTAATIYLTENGALSCTPSGGTLGDCSDGLTITANPTTGQLNLWFVSEDASANEFASFFANVSTNVSFLAETGLLQDVSSTFGQSAGFAQVQSDIDAVTVPEPLTLSLFGSGLVGLGALRRRKTAKA